MKIIIKTKSRQAKNLITFNALSLIIPACLTFFMTSLAVANESSQHRSGPTSSHSSKKMANFGPGDHYQHAMHVKPSDFKKIKDISKSAKDLPNALNRKQVKTVKIDLDTIEVISDIAPGISYHYWTFNNTVPGPFLRVREDDIVELSLHNDKSSSHSHAIDLHAVTGPGGGKAVTEVEPGETKTLVFKATTPGLFIYHCAAGNPATHIANGMYGMILVEPKKGMKKVDHEFYVMQGELYTKGRIGKKGFQAFNSRKMIDERAEYIVFNGRTGALIKDGQLEAKVGDRVRIFFGNAGVTKISSFHIIGEIFDKVYPEAALNNPLKDVQTTLVPAGGATIVEFKVDYPGAYVLVDHALARVDRGAWGILNVTGAKNDKLYSGDSASDHNEDSEEDDDEEHHMEH